MNRATDLSDITLKLHLEVADPDVVTELGRYPDGDERHRYALAGLRLGVLSLR
jgi:hypothetical protein